ncbi:MAG: GAF domain-containing protein, partial [Anaerolineae bacterium]|nr:GAF domain-containing protein [Anaerolineae bacterium]
MDSLPDINARRILLVLDDPTLSAQVGDALRADGYAVETAYNTGDALAAQHARFSLALIDSRLKDRAGRPIRDLIREHPGFSKLPVLALDQLRGFQAGAQGASFDGKTLLVQVGALFGRRPDGRPVAREETLILRQVVAADMAADVAAAPADEPRPTETQLQRQMAALKTLSALGRSITSVLDLNTVLKQIVEAATTLTGAEEGLLLLPDRNDQALYLRAMKGIDDASARNFRIRNADNVVASVYRRGEPVLLSDQQPMQLKTQYFVRSLVYVPMTYQGQVIGVLGVNNRRSGRAFTPVDQELLLDLAAHAAIAIENARMYEERLLQNRQLTTLVQASIAANSTLALPEILLTICQHVSKALNFEACLFQQIDPVQEALITRAWVSGAAWRRERALAIPLAERPFLRKAIQSNAFYAIERGQPGDERAAEMRRLEQLGLDHLVVLPLRDGQGETPSGALDLFYKGRPPEISREYRAKARALAAAVCAELPQGIDTRLSPQASAALQTLLAETGAAWFSIWLFDGPERLLRVADCGASVSLESAGPPPEPFPEGMRVELEQYRVMNHHWQENDLPPVFAERMTALGADSMVCLPLRIKETLFGMFTVYGTLEARSARVEEIGLASALITQAAATIDNARLYRTLQRSLEDLKLAQASLVQAARLSTIGQLAAVVAHQINNPLTTVLADSELLLQDIPADSPMRDSVMAIRRAGERAHAVVKRLLSTARRGRAGDERQWVEVRQTILNTLDLVSTHIERSGVRLVSDVEAASKAFTQCTPGHLEDVWLNLLMNGRDALNGVRDAQLLICATRSEGHLTVRIEDNGVGIAPERLADIFEPFYTTKPPGEGTGLGLHVCKQIIEQAAG